MTVGFNAVSAATWECLFFDIPDGYQCTIQYAIIEEMETLRITGVHNPDRSNDNVTRIEIMTGDMQSIPFELFNTFKNLKYFRIWVGSLRSVSRLSNCRSLEDFEAGALGVSRLDSTAFVDCPNIKRVNLGFNNMRHLPAALFPMDAQLEQLYLEMSGITSIDPNFFAAIKNIGTLRLSGNTCIDNNFQNIGRDNWNDHRILFQQCFDGNNLVY